MLKKYHWAAFSRFSDSRSLPHLSISRQRSLNWNAISSHVPVARTYALWTGDGQTNSRQRLCRPMQVEEFILSRLKNFESECYVVAYLGDQLQLIACVGIALETIAPHSAYPCEIIKTAVDLTASALIVVHVRQSGSSCQDEKIDTTMIRQLKQVLPLIRVRLLDYITVTNAESTSMAAAGLM